METKTKVQKKKDNNKIRIVFLIVSLILIVILVAIGGFLLWTQSASGYQYLTNKLVNKPSNSWQVKAYYGLYKKYPYTSQISNQVNTNTVFQEPSYKSTDIYTNISYHTDKSLYHSGEQIQLALDISSKNKVDGASLYIYGIKNKHNEYSVSKTETINLAKNKTSSFNYPLNLPYCNSCSGVKEGDYKIYVKIIDNENLIGSTEIPVSLRQ
jgi:flagellar basal body-associated protein FliL